MACVNTINNKLYYNLVNMCDSEEQAQDLYARIMNPEFIKDYKIKTDNDGNLSFRDVYNKSQLGRHLKQERQIEFLNVNLGSKTMKASPENIDSMCNEVELFNRDNEVDDFVAIIERNGDEITSKIVRKNYQTDELSKQIKTNADLNNFLRTKLSEIGVGVGTITELERRRGIAGVTDFELAKDATNGIVELIRISKDEKGEEALPEEFSHFALEAVGENNPLVSRLYNSITEEIARAVLGNQFDRYMQEYDNDISKVQKEVAGKLLADYIKSEYTGDRSNLLERVFDAIKDQFSGLEEMDFRTALIELDATLSEASKKILFSNLLKEVGIKNLQTATGEYYQIDEEENTSPTDNTFPKEFLSDELNAKHRQKEINEKSKRKVESLDDDEGVQDNEEGIDINDEGIVDNDEGVSQDEGISNYDNDSGVNINDEGTDVFNDEGVNLDEDEDYVDDDTDEGVNTEQVLDNGIDSQLSRISIDYDEGSHITDFEELATKNKATELNRINIDKLQKQFDKDVTDLQEDLKQEGEFDKISKLFLNIESSLIKLNVLNKKKGFVFTEFDRNEKVYEYLYKNKNMLGNLLYFVHNSIKNLHTAWDMYENPRKENRQCDNLLVFKNTIESLEYMLNTTDMQNIMDVLAMNFSNESDIKIQSVINKYVKELSYHLNQAKQFVQNETLLLTKEILSERFGDKFEIPMTLSESQTLTLDNELSNGTQEDVSTLTRFFSSMANSPSLILKIVDQIVKKSNNNRRNKVFDLKRKIVALGKKYVESSGSTDFSFLYHKDKNGNRTGYYVDETDYARYDRMYKKIVVDKKDKWCPNGKFNKKKYIDCIKKFQEYMESHGNFHNKEWDKLTNTQREFAKEFLEIKRELDRHMYYEMETIYDTDAFPEIEDMPIDDIDDYYDDRAKSGDWIAKKKEERRIFMHNKRAAKTIKIEKSLINKLKSSKGVKGVKNELQRALKEMFVKTSSDVELTESSKASLTDFEGKRVYDIPRLFTSKQESESEENMSMDAISTLIAYSDAAENRYEKMQIVSLLEMITDIVNKRQLAVTKGKSIQKRKFKTNFGEFSLPIVTNGTESNIAAMLKDYMESQIYGMWNIELGNVGDTNISKDKIGNMLLSQTALTGMALNILGSISNVETGKAMMRMESICGQFFNVKDVAKADLEYTKNIGAVIANAGELIKDNKLAIFIDQFNLLQDYEQEVLHTEFDTNKFMRCCSEQGLFILNNLGEHFLQTRTGLSVAFSTKLKDKDGKEISLWEAMELRYIDSEHPEYGKKIFLKEGVTKLDGTKIEDVQEYFDKITHRIAAINQRMHGIYNYEDRCAAQRYMIGRFFYQFRKYIPSSIQRRFGQAQINFDLDSPTEGYYRTFAKFWKKVYTETKAKRGGLLTVWKSMNKWEKQNCIRSIVEMSQTLLVFGGTMLLESVMGDKKKQSPWAVKMLYYQTRRLYTELASFTPSTGMLNEGLKLVDSPFAGVRIMDKNIEFLEAIKPWNWIGENAEIEQGKWKGHTKGYKAAMQILPVYSSWLNAFDPYEAAKFYNR